MSVWRFYAENGVTKFEIVTSTKVTVAPGDPVIEVNQKLTVSVEPETRTHATVKPAVFEVQVGGFAAEKVW